MIYQEFNFNKENQGSSGDTNSTNSPKPRLVVSLPSQNDYVEKGAKPSTIVIKKG